MPAHGTANVPNQSLYAAKNTTNSPQQAEAAATDDRNDDGNAQERAGAPRCVLCTSPLFDWGDHCHRVLSYAEPRLGRVLLSDATGAHRRWFRARWIERHPRPTHRSIAVGSSWQAILYREPCRRGR